MSKKQWKYTVENLMEVRFRQKLVGYHPADVDTFLDNVLQDYAAYDKEIERLHEEIDQLKKGYGYK